MRIINVISYYEAKERLNAKKPVFALFFYGWGDMGHMKLTKKSLEKVHEMFQKNKKSWFTLSSGWNEVELDKPLDIPSGRHIFSEHIFSQAPNLSLIRKWYFSSEENQ